MDYSKRKIPSLSSNSVVLGVLLAMVGGFLDAYTYISREGVFANAQTGNMVLFAVKVATKHWRESLLYIPPILAFVLGVLVAEIVMIPRLRHLLYSSRRSILILECLVLFIVGMIPNYLSNTVVTMCIAFVSSVQISAFTKLDKWNYNSTMTTGNLKTATKAAYAALVEGNEESKRQFKKFIGVILSFLFGALAGTFSTTYMGNRSIWFASGVLVIALVLYHRDRGYFRNPVTT